LTGWVAYSPATPSMPAFPFIAKAIASSP
jgi:hypothetical protein